MGLPVGKTVVVRFADCLVNLQTAELVRDDKKTILQDQPFKILTILLESEGQLVTREELVRKLWPSGTYVDFDPSLNKAIARLREALGDNAEHPRFVETLPKRGYRWIGGIEPSAENGKNATDIPEAPYQTPSTTVVPAETFDRRRLSVPIPVWIVAGTIVAIVLGFAGRRLLWSRFPHNRVQRALTRVTFDAGLQVGATWSPDGRFLAYSSNHSGKFDIWLQQVSGGDAFQITHTPGENWQPQWSPDGKYIVYRSEEGRGGLYVVPALGGVSRKISSFGHSPRWSPDATQILFLPTSFGGSASLYTVSVDGGQPRSVLDHFFATHHLTVRSAAWHPDNKRVTVYVWDYKTSLPVFWTVPIQRGDAVQSELDPSLLSKLGDTTPVQFPDDATFSWDPTGRAIYFELALAGATNLWKMKLDPRTLRGIDVERLTTGPGIDCGVSLSLDGKKLAFNGESRKTQIWVAPFDFRSGKLTGKGDAVTPASIEAWSPALSPDGQRLAFSGGRGGVSQIWQKSLPGGIESPIAGSDSYRRAYPAWSPDGQRLVYPRWKLHGLENSIAIWSSQSHEESFVVDGSDYDVYGWTPDGKKLVVSKWNAQTDRAEVWLVPLDSRLPPEKIAAKPEYYLFQGQSSPDGRWIAFEATRDVTSGRESTIYVVPARGGSWIRVTDSQQWDDKPRWSPDGKTIYFVSGQGGFYNVWGTPFDSVTGRVQGAPFRVTNFSDPALMVPTFIPDVGLSVALGHLAVTVSQSSGSIWVLDNVD